jgi:hypothetical protein
VKLVTKINVGFHFADDRGNRISSTEFAKFLLAKSLDACDPALAASVRSEGNWRKNYQRYFLATSKIEFANRNRGFDLASSALATMGAQIIREDGASLSQLAQIGFGQRNLVHTIRVKGGSVAQRFWPEADNALPEVADSWAQQGLAEDDVVRAFEFLHRNPSLPIADDLLIALAGNAELAPTRDWLSMGGRVAVVARPNPKAWQELIAHARSTAGELLICVDSSVSISSTASDEEIAAVAGLNFVDQVAEVASWVHDLSRNENRIVISSNAYVGGSKQIIAQAAQDAIIGVASDNIARAKLALSWLATPLDVVVADASIAEKQLAAFDIRSFAEKVRDAIFAPWGQLKPAQPELVDSPNGKFTNFDASSVRQGSSYLLAKHSEKWRALVSARRGNLTSFTVAPPATTRSVLRVKVLEKTYRGLGAFGIAPFEATAARRAMALILLRNLHDPASPAAPQNSAKSPVAMVSATAIHGGIWRLGYHPDSIWVAATLLGWLRRK